MITKEFAVHLNAALETQRLMLEPLMAAHADILYDNLCDERIYRWIDAGGPKNKEELRLKWQRNESRLSPDGTEARLNWAIRLREVGPYIGKLDAQLNSPHNASNVGFVFFPKYWGQGYASEALLAVKAALVAQGVVSMRATVATPNIGSARVLEKAGFLPGEMVTDEVDTRAWHLTISSTAKT